MEWDYAERIFVNCTFTKIRFGGVAADLKAHLDGREDK